MTCDLYAWRMARHGGRNPAKYRRIADDLRARIERGEWAVDTRMPTQAELSAQYGDVSLGTVDKALGVLRELGMAETIHGTGTFVRKPPPAQYDEVMRRVDGIAAEVRQLREDVAALKRAQEA